MIFSNARVAAFVTALLVCTGAGCVAQSTITSYSVKTDLYAKHADGTESQVYLGTMPDSPAASIAVAPDNAHVVYAVWENAGFSIYLTDLPKQWDAKQIARQSIPEGHGGLDPTSLTWVDANTIQYRESGATCGESGQPSIINPTTSCDGDIMLIERVDTRTGEKVLWDKWLQNVTSLKK